jgi:hypothetical protein
MSRMVGATFGVAALGALVAAVERAKVEEQLPALPAGQREALAHSLGAAASGPGVSANTSHVLREAFVSALGSGLLMGAGVALAGAVLAWLLIARGVTAATPSPPMDAAAATPAADPATAELGREPARA